MKSSRWMSNTNIIYLQLCKSINYISEVWEITRRILMQWTREKSPILHTGTMKIKSNHGFILNLQLDTLKVHQMHPKFQWALCWSCCQALYTALSTFICCRSISSSEVYGFWLSYHYFQTLFQLVMLKSSF